MKSPRSLLHLTAALALSLTFAHAEHVSNPKASYIDVAQRHAQLAAGLASNKLDSRTAAAIASLKSCTMLAPVQPPTGRIIIPSRYFSGGHGPVNPEEEKVTGLYHQFEERVTAGMNQWLVTSSPAEAQCAQQQIDSWAQAATLLDYDPKESSQAWFQIEWTISAVAISESVLVNEPSLDPTLLKRDIAWMNRVAHRTVDFDKAGTQTNNHHYWRGLAATAVGVISSDDTLFTWGVNVYKQAINEIDPHGAFPQEMARHERAIHYQSFALQPLVPLAAFATRQSVPLFAYKSPTGRTIDDSVRFFGEALANPQIVKPYAPNDKQLLTGEGADFFSFAELYSRYSPHPQLTPSILKGLSKPTYSSRIGGNLTVIAGYTPPHS